jgi:AraC-like DNA-binding protein
VNFAKKMNNKPLRFESISQLHRAMHLPEPLHPLISIINYGDATYDGQSLEAGMILDFYKISFKTNFNGKLRYGQGYYDFESGGMSFVAPGQLLRPQEEEADYSGYSLNIHPDFLRPYTLGKNIKQFGFFAYSTAEGLYLSEKEKVKIAGVFDEIQDELAQRIDAFSQDVIISNIELLLNHSNRFYNRQFLTRKALNHDVLLKVEEALDRYFSGENALVQGLPTVQYLADKVHLSPRYLSDVLRSITGQNTQQLIHERVIEQAKQMLTAGSLNVAEVAYQLGFEHPQSFSKLFKKKTNLTPLAYKDSLG